MMLKHSRQPSRLYLVTQEAEDEAAHWRDAERRLRRARRWSTTQTWLGFAAIWGVFFGMLDLVALHDAETAIAFTVAVTVLSVVGSDQR